MKAWGGWLLALPGLLLAGGLLLWPLVRTLQAGGIAWAVWQEPYFWGRAGWTLAQALLTALLALLLGTPLAYLLAQHRVPGQGWLLRLLLLPFVTPTMVAVLGISALWGPRGWCSSVLGLKLGDSATLVILGNLFFNLPLLIRLGYGGFSRVSPQLLAAARSLGASPWPAFWRVALPLAAPGLAAGFVLVFLYSALSFGLPLALGGERHATLEVEIYTLTALQLRLSEASALIAGQLLLTGGATLLYLRLNSLATGNWSAQPRPLPAWGRLLLWALLTVTLLLCFAPLLAVLGRSFWSSDGLSLSAWRGLLADPDFGLLLGNTLRFGLWAGGLAVLLGGAYALGTALSRSRLLDGLSLLPLMVSPVSLAVGYLLAYPAWAASLPLLLAAYTLLAWPLIIRSLLPALRAIPPRLYEAARLLGAGPLSSACRLTWPLSWPALSSGAALALATVFGEFGATLVLTRPEWATLSTGLYERLGRPGERNLSEACALASVLLLLALSAFALLDRGRGEVG